MAGAPQQLLAMALAFGGALCYAVAAVWQQRCAARQPAGTGMDARLLVRLGRDRGWLLSLLVVLAGYGFHAAALGFGRLVVVEPVIPLGLLMALILGARAEGRRLCSSEWAAAVAAVAGLGVFLVAAEPSGGQQTAGTGPLGLAVAGAVAAAALCFGLTGRLRAHHRAVPISIAGGIAAGVTDTVTKSVVPLAGTQQLALLGDLRLWLLPVAGLLALTLQQNAYRAAGLGASLPAFAVLQPMTGALLGLIIYHEHIGGGGLRITIEVLAVAAAVWGIARLAQSVIAELARLAAVPARVPSAVR